MCISAGSIDCAEALIELASLHSSNGDDYEAEKLFLQAEQMLDDVQVLKDRPGDPSGRDLADALTKSLLDVSKIKVLRRAAPIERMIRVNGLYRELCMGLARIYAATKPEKASHYREKAAKRDSRAENDEFSASMMRALQGELGKL